MSVQMRFTVFAVMAALSCTHGAVEDQKGSGESYGLQYGRVHGTLLQSWQGDPIFLGTWDGGQQPYRLSAGRIEPILPDRHRDPRHLYQSLRILSDHELLLMRKPGAGEG
ncbi:MAG TPA: hypothetical protein VFV50_01695, partial [Bdellovibrionales bacterium]|nr:hypothetical protein [Bdellovibrionales bacterium]